MFLAHRHAGALRGDRDGGELALGNANLVLTVHIFTNLDAVVVVLNAHSGHMSTIAR